MADSYEPGFGLDLAAKGLDLSDRALALALYILRHWT